MLQSKSEDLSIHFLSNSRIYFDIDSYFVLQNEINREGDYFNGIRILWYGNILDLYACIFNHGWSLGKCNFSINWVVRKLCNKLFMVGILQ